MELVPFRPLRMLSRWPDFWDETDFGWGSARDSLDIFETTDEVVVKANVAGVDIDHIDLTFEDGVLWIKAAKEDEQEDKDKTHYAKASWSYSYKVAVPGNIDMSKDPEASLDSGVLTVGFPKLEETKPRKLSIKAKSSK
jgi:HSP20 family protein